MGDVPSHWKLVRFKHVLSDKKKTLRPDLPAGSISFGKVVYKDAEILSNETKASYQEVLSGEFLVNPLNLNYDLISLRTALSSIDVVVSTGYIVLKSSGDLNANYTRWLLQQFDVAHMKTLGAGVRQTINYADIGNSYFSQPTSLEQTQIAAFLDHETAKIDLLIGQQQELIRLLKEKRQAVISHAVTKGLNPHAPLKDSGIEWLGQVPAHWSVKPLKYLMSLTSGGTPSKDNLEYWEGTIPWASSKDLKSDELFDTQDHITQKALDIGGAALVPTGSILTVVRGMILLHTFPVVVTRVPMAINQDLKAIQPTAGITADFLAWLLRGASEVVLSTTDEAGHGTKVLRMESWLAIQVPIPPLKEQASIVAGIIKRLGQLDNLTNDAYRATDLLQERRTALISAAVTGKIDVRAWQPGGSLKGEVRSLEEEPPVVSKMETPEATAV